MRRRKKITHALYQIPSPKFENKLQVNFLFLASDFQHPMLKVKSKQSFFTAFHRVQSSNQGTPHMAKKEEVDVSFNLQHRKVGQRWGKKKKKFKFFKNFFWQLPKKNMLMYSWCQKYLGRFSWAIAKKIIQKFFELFFWEEKHAKLLLALKIPRQVFLGQLKKKIKKKLSFFFPFAKKNMLSSSWC